MFQSIKKSIAAKLVGIFVISTILFSFTNIMGGDSFEVYLNNKLVFQQYVTKGEAVKSLQLDQPNAEIQVYYSHCGQTGTSRTISIRDGQSKILKEWHFQDAPGTKSMMSCNAKDILSLQKLSSGGTLNLYYTSHELPAGRLLAAIIATNGLRVSR